VYWDSMLFIIGLRITRSMRWVNCTTSATTLLIHLASAAQAGTDLFLTNDKSLVGKIVPGIQFIAMLDTQIL